MPQPALSLRSDTVFEFWRKGSDLIFQAKAAEGKLAQRSVGAKREEPSRRNVAVKMYLSSKL